MSLIHQSRRRFIGTVAGAAGVLAMSPEAQQESNASLVVDPTPRFSLSPYLYMQFMEPLGTTDGSVAAAWDFGRDCWREDVVDATSELGPTMLRWGGCFASYYRWKEGVGPRDQRKLMFNQCWGGMETNQVGTHEFVDFSRRVGAEPLICVNLESDGKSYFARSPKGDDRSAGPEEAAEWVRYCNDPDSPARRRHGHKEPYNVRFWQLGNETSYGQDLFDRDGSIERTVTFAKAMRREDPEIKLIGWGDSGWAPRMIEEAGEHLDYVAFHHMFNPDAGMEDSPLRGIEYRKDPPLTWERLMRAHEVHEARIRGAVEEIADSDMPLAMTECHFALPGRNRCEVLSTWAAGVADAQLLNVHERYGARLKIATLADFCGTRWQVNAVMIPVPGGRAYMMPVALVMCLYRHHTGEQALSVERAPDGLDVTASRTGNRLFLHVVNRLRQEGVSATLGVPGLRVASGRVFELAADPEFEVIETQPREIVPQEQSWPESDRWTFPPASVSAVELEAVEV
jgi:alpha-N-arabinofuranosidase